MIGLTCHSMLSLGHLGTMTLFADDNYITRYNKRLDALIEDMKQSLEMITKSKNIKRLSLVN